MLCHRDVLRAKQFFKRLHVAQAIFAHPIEKGKIGRIERTIFALVWLLDPRLRQRGRLYIIAAWIYHLRYCPSRFQNNIFFTSAKEFRKGISNFFEDKINKIAPFLRGRIRDDFQTIKPVRSSWMGIYFAGLFIYYSLGVEPIIEKQDKT